MTTRHFALAIALALVGCAAKTDESPKPKPEPAPLADPLWKKEPQWTPGTKEYEELQKHWRRMHTLPERVDVIEQRLKVLIDRENRRVEESRKHLAFPPGAPGIGCAYGWIYTPSNPGRWSCLEESRK